MTLPSPAVSSQGIAPHGAPAVTEWQTQRLRQQEECSAVPFAPIPDPRVRGCPEDSHSPLSSWV